jgi:hypothetical protein
MHCDKEIRCDKGDVMRHGDVTRQRDAMRATTTECDATDMRWDAMTFYRMILKAVDDGVLRIVTDETKSPDAEMWWTSTEMWHFTDSKHIMMQRQTQMKPENHRLNFKKFYWAVSITSVWLDSETPIRNIPRTDRTGGTTIQVVTFASASQYQYTPRDVIPCMNFCICSWRANWWASSEAVHFSSCFLLLLGHNLMRVCWWMRHFWPKFWDRWEVGLQGNTFEQALHDPLASLLCIGRDVVPVCRFLTSDWGMRVESPPSFNPERKDEETGQTTLPYLKSSNWPDRRSDGERMMILGVWDQCPINQLLIVESP